MGDVQSWSGGWPPNGRPGHGPAPAPAPAPYGAPPAFGAPQPYGAPHAAMRAAHTDRERTVDVLKAAYAEGRLSAGEYGERFDAAQAAQTYGQLAQLVGDLPAGPGLAPVGVPAAPVPPTFLPPPVKQSPNNGMAIASLVLGLLCLPSMGLTGLPAVVTGHVARGQIRRSRESGDGMATFGLVVGYLSLAGWAMFILFGMMIALHGG
ncbi:DUF1707 and DUF4190 domain-containing protein [Kitasatospora sp. NPDC006697]|uniref:DUF1707 and DUF4190 domain-containing protein n=1 Tax=Kitasatospora sp. NPDC006697 TaxID=3364020 RepID=UPI0036B7F607